MCGEGSFYNGNGDLIYEGDWDQDEFNGRGVEYNDLV